MILFKYLKYFNYIIINMVRIVSWNVNGIRSNIFCEGSLKKNKKIYKELNASNLKHLIDK